MSKDIENNTGKTHNPVLKRIPLKKVLLIKFFVAIQ